MSRLDDIEREAKERRDKPDIPRGDYDSALMYLATTLDSAEAAVDELVAMVRELESRLDSYIGMLNRGGRDVLDMD